MEFIVIGTICIAAILIVAMITGTITELAKIKAGKMPADDKAEIVAEVKRQLAEEQRPLAVDARYTNPETYAEKS